MTREELRKLYPDVTDVDFKEVDLDKPIEVKCIDSLCRIFTKEEFCDDFNKDIKFPDPFETWGLKKM